MTEMATIALVFIGVLTIGVMFYGAIKLAEE